MLEVSGLNKHYGKTEVLKDVSFKVEQGEIFGVIGQNGAGKTTLLKIIAGLLEPDGGSVSVDGELLARKPFRGSLEIGYVPDHYQLYDHLRVMEYMEFYAGFYKIARDNKKQWLSEILSMVDLLAVSDTYVEKLSQEMRQRLCVARALLPNPQILILDEPGSGMDPKARIEFRKNLRTLSGKGRTILISSHMVSGIPDYCSSIGILEKGKMILKGDIYTIMEEVKKNQPLVIQVLSMVEEAIQVLKANPCVRKISLDGQCLRVLFEGDGGEEAELLSQLVLRQVPVQSFGREAGDLESSFLDLIS